MKSFLQKKRATKKILFLVAFMFSIVLNSQSIEVQGDGIVIPDSNVPSVADGSDYGSIAAYAESKVVRFYIHNTGSSFIRVNISLQNTTFFWSVNLPVTNRRINAGNSTYVDVGYTTDGVADFDTGELVISTTDGSETTTINLLGRSSKVFFDSDGDTLTNDVDVDDDNDGLDDGTEELNCKVSPNSQLVNYKFLYETFGAGTERVEINTTYDATTTYTYRGLVGQHVGDGGYTVRSRVQNNDGNTANDLGSWAEQYWYEGTDHTGDLNGRMAIFNASYDPGVFYTATIYGSLPNIPITYDFYAINIDRTDAPNIATRLRPNIRVDFYDLDDNLLTDLATGNPASISTGDIPPTTAGNIAGDWQRYTADLTFDVTEFYVVFTNNETGGQGNDLAIDDIQIAQTLCDSDDDGVADVFDIDADNDGILDIHEFGFTAYDGGGGYTNIAGDTNGNGQHDATEGQPILDTDGDGVPDYLDLDSDNDGIFDVDESGSINYVKGPSYVNGDGDINGDGVGNGIETEAFRENDADGDGVPEYFGDGVLDIFEHTDGNYGVLYQTTPVDTDFDGIPDYLDPFTFGVADISTTIYADLDTNNDGLIDDADLDGIVDPSVDDVDSDGILDLFDTDLAYFGSPRDLERDLYVHFDGRNDYMQDVSLLGGLASSSLMAWINIDDLYSSTGYILGQDNFNIRLDATRNLIAEANGITITYGIALNTSQWIHVGAVYDSGNNVFTLYVNGAPVGSTTAASSLNADSSLFTVAKNASSDTEYFYGGIEEVKVFDVALTDLQLQKMVYQEVSDNGNIQGDIIPLDVDVSWSNLIRYYRMDAFKDDVVDDYSTATVDTGSGARIYNVKELRVETAPIPFITEDVASNLDLAVAVSQNNDVRGDDVKDYDWSITHIRHNMELDANHTDLGLIVDTGVTVNVVNNSGLMNDWYLNLNGFLNLQGESQLVQTGASVLDANSDGYIWRDQQGTANSSVYNYWASPVGGLGAGNNKPYTLSDVLYNATDPNNPIPIDFCDGWQCADDGNVNVSTRWLYKFINQKDEYANWDFVGSTGSINVSEGFTMKGTIDGASIDMSVASQNYTFVGKPNNAPVGSDIVHTTFVNGEEHSSLVGNPFPSAMDANVFITDNLASTTGVLYFWEHWSDDTHVLADYQGGYATYSLSGSLPDPQLAESHPDIDQTGSGTVLPGRYIPVAQGFFVYASVAGGDVIFNNSQRAFAVEDGNPDSNFARGSVGVTSEEPQRIRLGFESSDHYHRQIMLAFLDGATDGIDRGYDALAANTLKNDVLFTVDDKDYVIQAFEELNKNREIPLTIIVDASGSGEPQKIMIDELENISSDQEIYIKDKETNVYHDLRASSFEFTLEQGKYNDKYAISFNRPDNLLSVSEDFLFENIEVYINNVKSSLEVKTQNDVIVEKVSLFNSLGQEVKAWLNNENQNELSFSVQLKTGVYLVNIDTNYGKETRKVIVK